MWSTCQGSLTHTACRYMVVLSGTSLADSLLPWWLPSINIFKWIWRVPRDWHTWILHKIADLDSISVFNWPIRLSDHFSRKTCESDSHLRHSWLLYSIQHQCINSSYHYCAHKYVKLYFEEELICADFTRYLHISNSSYSSLRDLDIESMIQIICCN